METNSINKSLQKLFLSHRIIFWYDEKQDFADHFRDMEIPEIEKILVSNDQFNVKNRLIRQEIDKKFLLYFSSPRPENKDNWLLDIELANYVFHTDQEALFLQELEMGYHLKEFIAEHLEFFKSKERREEFKELISSEDDLTTLRYKMLAVTFNCENAGLEALIMAHAATFIKGQQQTDKDLERFNLRQFYWNEIGRRFHYISDMPSIYDFLLDVFAKNFSLTAKSPSTRESRIFLSLWKDTRSHQNEFSEISDLVASDLQVENLLNSSDADKLLSDDLFRLIDRRIIADLISLIVQESISTDRLGQIVKNRHNKYWYQEYADFYEALLHARDVIALVRKFEAYRPGSFQETSEMYTSQLFKIDYHYRKFIWHYRKLNQNRALEPLADKIYKVYSNDWLLNFNNLWQEMIEKTGDWPVSPAISQRHFFTNHVSEFAGKGHRLFVIISDAFRYECGWELMQDIQAEKRFDAEVDWMITGLPSYTQSGMAALLPNTEIIISAESEGVMVDGLSSMGLQGRAKILAKSSGVRATAINAEDFMRMNAKTDGRDFVKQYDLIYIYHNRIDKTGDDKVSEDKVFEAVTEEINFLLEVLKKIDGMNGTNMLITADHGFLYQHHLLEESDFTDTEIEGDIFHISRRYVIGRNLNSSNAVMHFKAQDLGWQGDTEILIPKSINRLRVKGAGSRFIHGGATLQETVIPVLKINKKRLLTTSQVGIDIIKSTDRITTNILAVSFLQEGMVEEKVLPRKIRAGIYGDDGVLLSDQFTYTFDITEGSERQREVKHSFQLSSKASGKYKNQRVRLILEEPVEGTSKWKYYKDYYYTLNISFTSDFDE
ncbi:MAG: BREX-1 system phosphatase PglZ type A [Bacteroidales bacterium]|nr:BREX-1 system phosphatase PglZ type A [Bacteroidales bacterium]